MTPVEFRQFVFRTPEQWRYGTAFRLHAIGDGGFRLFSAPVFNDWLTQVNTARWVRSLAVDSCGRALWVHEGDLYRRDSVSGMVDQPTRVASGSRSKAPAFGRMLHAGGRIWIHDRRNARLIGLRGDTFQIVAEIPLPAAIDVTSGGGRLFALDAGAVRSFDSVTGEPIGRVAIPQPASPVAVGAAPDGRWIYAIDASKRSFLRLGADGRCHDEIGGFDDVTPTFAPRLLCVDSTGNLFVADGSGSLHEFAPDGGYIGQSGSLGPLTAILALACGGDGYVYAADPAGIARFAREGGVSASGSGFYSGTLDNGTTERSSWHRIDLVADITDEGAVDVWYATSNDAALAEEVSQTLGEPSGSREKAATLERLFADRWRGPHQLRAAARSGGSSGAAAGGLASPPTHSVLIEGEAGRYLWLKLVLSGLAPGATASVREVRVVYPRLSYLRYLPAVYQEDKPSREFLERFLSVFETVFSGLENTIERVPELFDPGEAPTAFLDWLAQWLDLAVEEDWPADVKRRLIREAARLYARKGTPAGLADLIELVTGRRPTIRESFETDRPYVLGTDVPLGTGTRVSTPARVERPASEQTRLGRGSILGAMQIRSDVTQTVDPFLAAAHRFTVVLDLSPQEYRRHARGLHRMIREQSPAHAAYDLQVASGAGLGSNAVVGVNLRVDDPQPLHLGYSTLGRAICRRNVSYGPELGVGLTVTGRADGSRGESAVCCGE